MAHDVFVSYANQNRRIADAVVGVLESRGIRCWIAPRDVTPGLDWSAEIMGGIEHARVFVLVYSAAANESVQVKREVERAVHRGIPLIPFRIEDVPMSKALEYFISSAHWLDALTPPIEQHLHQLAGTVSVLLDRSGTGTTATLRARRRARAELRAKLGAFGRTLQRAALITAGIVAIGVGGWVLGRYGAGGGGTANAPRNSARGVADSLLEQARTAPVGSSRSTSRDGGSAPVPAVTGLDSALVGTWIATDTVDGKPVRHTLTVMPSGRYRHELTSTDMGNFYVRGDRNQGGLVYQMFSRGGPEVNGRIDSLGPTVLTMTGPLETLRFSRTGGSYTPGEAIGEWQTNAVRDKLPWRITLTIGHGDYHLVSRSIDEGQLQARGNAWTMTSETRNGTRSGGSYQVPDANTMLLSSADGTTRWMKP